jgi:hypothetical protein
MLFLSDFIRGIGGYFIIPKIIPKNKFEHILIYCKMPRTLLPFPMLQDFPILRDKLPSRYLKSEGSATQEQ